MPDPEPRTAPAPAPETSPRLRDLLLLIAGVGLSLWLFSEDLREVDLAPGSWDESAPILILGTALGGLAFLGPPLLLWRGRRRGSRRARRPWGAGRLLWFANGTAAWLLWPPVLSGKVLESLKVPRAIQTDTVKICYFYGTPLMALYVSIALIAGGHLRPRSRGSRRRGPTRARRPADWTERFGSALGLAWAALGLYVLALIYLDELR